MARNRTKGNDKATEASANVQTEEATVSQTATENPEATNENTEAPKAEATEVDLTAFNKAVEAAVENADTDTGEVPEASMAEVTTAYRALDGVKAKNAAKKVVNEAMKDAMNSNSLPRARSYLMISENALTAGSHGGTSTPADPTEAFVQRVATLQLGYHLATSKVPDGVNDNWQDRVTELVNSSLESANELVTYLSTPEGERGDEPDVTAVVRNAVKLAQGKAAKAGASRAGGTFTGERRDIGKHIQSAFEGKDKGTFLTIAEIRNARSEEYGDSQPSAGAISARLDEKDGKKSSMRKVGIIPDMRDGKRGAYLGDPEE